VKSGDKQSNRLTGISDYVGNVREMEDKLVPVCLSIEQNEPAVSIGSHTQPSKSIGNKNRIISMAPKRTGCSGHEKAGEKF
jgi:hypothetical protein